VIHPRGYMNLAETYPSAVSLYAYHLSECMYCRKKGIHRFHWREREGPCCSAASGPLTHTQNYATRRTLVQCIQHEVDFRTHEPEFFFLKSAVEVQVVAIIFLYCITCSYTYGLRVENVRTMRAYRRSITNRQFFYA
jgi:hypothetical protein